MANIITPISIDVRTQKPLEPKRGPVQSVSDLINPESWSYDIDSEGNMVFYVYPGMLVSVIGTEEIYMLKYPHLILDKQFLGWRLVSGGVGGAEYDGGNAQSVYTNDQIMDAGNALNEVE